MDEGVLNIQVRKFLKHVGVTSQREIEGAIRTALQDGRLKGSETLKAQVRLSIGEIGLDQEIDGTIALD